MNSPKLPGVICGQYEIKAAGMRGNPEIIGADQCSLPFQISTYICIVFSHRIPERQYVHIIEKSSNSWCFPVSVW